MADWSALPDDILALVATSGRLAAADLCSMRGACRGWLGALPATGGQWLAMSLTTVERGRCGISFWAISAPEDAPEELVPMQAWSLPVECSCWGSSRGWLALRNLDGELFLHRPVGGEQETMPPQPEGMEPEGVFVRPYVSAFPTHGIFGSQLYFYNDDDDDDIDNDDDDDYRKQWFVSQRFNLAMARTVGFGGLDTLYAAGYPDTMAILPILLEQADIATFDLDGLKPWSKNGHHLFVLNEEFHLCVLCHPEDDMERTVAILYVVNHPGIGQHELIRRHTIGHNSLFLGANHAIVCPSDDEFAGRRPDTIYVEHNDGERRRPELLLIHLGTQDVQTIPFPPPLAENLERFGPACWVNPLAVEDREEE